MSEYVNKDKFVTDIKSYRLRKQNNADEPIPAYSAECIMKIANKLANRPNFIGYSYRSDMISDGIYVCLKYFDKFDPDKSTNPFGYFTQCIWFAFLQRIAKEKKQTAIRSKIIAQTPFELFDVQDQDLDESFRNSYTEFLQEHNYSPIDVTESDVRPKVKPKKKRGEIMAMQAIDEDENPEEVLIEELAEVDILEDLDNK